MVNEVDLHLGKRLRRRRRLLGLTQEQLGEKIGVRFQQIQKYECGSNRITAGRLYDLAIALDVQVQYFYEGLPGIEFSHSRSECEAKNMEELALLRAARQLPERVLKSLVNIAKTYVEITPANDGNVKAA